MTDKYPYQETDASRELALSVINDGRTYRARCEAAKYGAAGKAEFFERAAHVEAVSQRQAYGKECTEFTAQDILLAALELVDYYDRHVAEIDAA